MLDIDLRINLQINLAGQVLAGTPFGTQEIDLCSKELISNSSRMHEELVRAFEEEFSLLHDKFTVRLINVTRTFKPIASGGIYVFHCKIAENVVGWALKDPTKAKHKFAKSAKEILDYLVELERSSVAI